MGPHTILCKAYDNLLTVFSDTKIRYCTEEQAFFVYGRKLNAPLEQIANRTWVRERLYHGWPFEGSHNDD